MAHASRNPNIAPVAYVATLAAVMATLSGCSKPAWQQPNPPLWAFVTSNNASDGHFRFFINTRAIRNNPDQRTVRVLMRTQRIAAGEEDSQDIPKDDEQTTVQNFTCDPDKKGYDISATLRMYIGKQFPEDLPPDSQLPVGVAAKDLYQFGDWNPLGRVRKAGCFLAGYK